MKTKPESIDSFQDVVRKLESLSIMPKTMPGLHKIEKALLRTDWFLKIDPNKVIVVAGTNGKGSTCAFLESLLLSAGQKVGFYSSPHLVSTTERIRVGGQQISEKDFVTLYQQCEKWIVQDELSHFEALTLMAGHFYFSSDWSQQLDFILFEVGLGGTFDATNAFPHATSVITALGLDHTHILGASLTEVAANKFGIVKKNNRVIHHPLPGEVSELQQAVQKQTGSHWLQAARGHATVVNSQWFLESNWGVAPLSLAGDRAAQNAMTALTVFQSLGFQPENHLLALNQTQWPGRMQKVKWPGLVCDLYLSGDHNPQGVQSLIEILNQMKWKTLHLLVGIGQDKDAVEMLQHLVSLPNVILYLTVTPFKGRLLDDYPEEYRNRSAACDQDVVRLIDAVALKATAGDLVLVTGSLYLVGEVLRKIAADEK